ncbi:MAG: hypothetical protein JRH20_12300 [Deltaproteobacteria bacterium]|nr:hypothetical protein [Deltaproteobacteria bacterium]
MAPEQAQGQNELVGVRADQFALATIAYEMLTGERLFVGDNIAETTFKVVFEHPEGLSRLAETLPKAAHSALERALQKKPDERFPNVVAFYAAFSGEEVCTGAPPVEDTPQNADTDVAAMLQIIEAEEAATAHAEDSVVPTPQAESSTSRPTVADHPKAMGAEFQKTRSPQPQPWVLALLVTLLLVALTVGGVLWFMQPSDGAPDTPQVAEKSTLDAQSALRLRVDAGLHDLSITTDSKRSDSKRSDSKRANSKRANSSRVPPKVAALLKQANTALRGRKFARALQLANRAQTHGRRPQIFSLMARAYCGLRDRGMVRAMMRNVSTREQRRIKRYCQKVGMPL